MTTPLTPPERDDLSSYLDQEGIAPTDKLNGSFNAQLHMRNLGSIQRAAQQAGSPIGEHPGFLDKLMLAIESVEQLDETKDFETLSAWHDQEEELDTEQVMHNSATAVASLKTLSTALQALPLPSFSSDFTTQVMATLEQVTAPDFDTLSACYDQATDFASVRCLSAADFSEPQQQQLQQFSALSQALQHLPGPQASVDFASNLLAALPEPELHFENASAWFDAELNAEAEPQHALVHNFQQLSQALQALPAPQAPADFANKLLSRLDQLSPAQVSTAEAIDFETLSENYDQAADPQQPEYATLSALSQALKALPRMTAPADFAERVMQALAAESPAIDFEELCARYDGEVSLTQAEQSALATRPEIRQLQSLSKALQALPQPEAPAHFVAKVMLATEQQSKAKLFALPQLFQTRLGQMVAGFAIFGFLVMLSQQLISPEGNQGITANVPNDYIVRVEHQPEDLLFSSEVESSLGIESALEITPALDQTTENDYNNLWIGG